MNDVEVTIKTSDGEKVFKGTYAAIGLVREAEDEGEYAQLPDFRALYRQAQW